MNDREFEEKALNLRQGIRLAQAQFDTPYEAGMDAGRYGSDAKNTHFCWFESRASSEDWSLGNAVGIRLMAKATANPAR